MLLQRFQEELAFSKLAAVFFIVAFWSEDQTPHPWLNAVT